MKIHHIGYAVEDMDKAKKYFVDLGYDVGVITNDETRKVEIAFAKNGEVVIELIAPQAPGSPVDNILGKNGPIPYHICYEVSNVDVACKEMKHKGWSVLRKPETAPAINGAKVAFLFNKSVGLIEIVEKNKQEGI